MKLEELLAEARGLDDLGERELLAEAIKTLDDALRITKTTSLRAFAEGFASALDISGSVMDRRIEVDKERAKIATLREKLARRLEKLDRKAAAVACDLCKQPVAMPLPGLGGESLCGLCMLKDVKAAKALGLELLGSGDPGKSGGTP